MHLTLFVHLFALQRTQCWKKNQNVNQDQSCKTKTNIKTEAGLRPVDPKTDC